MPSSAPTVSKAAGRAAQGRPEAWEVEGPGPIPGARALETGDHGRLHPGRVSARPPRSNGPRRKARIRNRRPGVSSLAAA